MRLFFALWPDETVRIALALLSRQIVARSQGRIVPAAKLHMTLAFLGEVPQARLDAACEAANAVASPGFEMSIDQIGSFAAARVAWAGTSNAPAHLASLQSSLADALRGQDFLAEDRPFAAHVTLARRIVHPVPPAPVAAIAWRADDFVLVRSETGRGSYSVLERWKLGARPKGRLE